MIPRASLNKIPGTMPVAKTETQIKDLSKLTRIQLTEIKEREEKILSNKCVSFKCSFNIKKYIFSISILRMKLNKLPDKGKKIKHFYEKVCNELEKHYNIEEAVAKFSELNIASTAHEKLNQLEWHGRLNDNNKDTNPVEDVLDSDDESVMDPLKIIAQHSMHEKKTVITPSEPELITPNDLKEIESFNHKSFEPIDAEIVTIDVSKKTHAIRQTLESMKYSGKDIKISSNKKTNDSNGHDFNSKDLPVSIKDSPTKTTQLDPHVRYIVDKVIDRMPEKEKFMPYKTTISNVHDPEKEKFRKKNLHWENTAATPPPIQHSGTKLVTLLDSVEIQTNYLSRLKVNILRGYIFSNSWLFKCLDSR